MSESIEYLEIEGARLWYALHGAGPPVIFLHAGIADSRMWGPQVDAFAERWSRAFPERVRLTSQVSLTCRASKGLASSTTWYSSSSRRSAEPVDESRRRR